MAKEVTKLTDTTQKIAKHLGETEKQPLRTIERITKVLGEERAMALLDETLKLEANGGLQTDDGLQRRTPGGVYFKLVKNKATSRERWLIFNYKRPAKPKPKPEPVTWEEIEHLSTKILDLPGEVSKVKLTLIGTPGRVIEKGDVVLTSLKSTKAPSLPKGLPKPPPESVTYLVFIAKKQWQKIKDSVENNPDDKLIIEGYPVFDKRIGKEGSMTLYAQFATTVLTQQARREAQKPEAGR